MAKEETIKSQIILAGEKEYRDACKNINSSLREIGSEMKLITAEFSGNADSTEALTKKQETLQKSLDEQAKKAEAAEAALKKMREGGVEPTNPAFQKMQTNLNNTKAEMIKTQAEIDNITASMNATTPASEKYAAEAANIDKRLGVLASEMKVVSSEYANNANSAKALKANLSVLKQTYSEQQQKVQSLEKALSAAKKEYGENSDEVLEYEKSLNECKAEMTKTKNEIGSTSKELKSSKTSWSDVGKAIGKAAAGIGTACAAMGAAVVGVAKGLMDLADETREARENMGKLETAFTTAGHSAESAQGTYAELYGVLGDDGQATEAAAHLAKLTTNEKELSDWTNICTGVYATFGDSLPIEGLTEAANETAKTGAITGNLADALNWAGVSEDEFQANLDACSSEQERQALITSTLNGLYSESANKYREVNGDIIDTQKATANLNNAMAALGAVAEPMIATLKQMAADLLQEITPFVELIGQGLTGALSGSESAAKDFTDGLTGMITFAIEKLMEFLPQFIEFAFQMIANIATGIAQALPTLIPALVQLVTDIVQSLIDNIPLLIDAALQLIKGLAQGILDAIPVLIDALPQLIDSLMNALLEGIPQILQAGIELITAIVDDLPTIINQIVAVFPQIIQSIVDALKTLIPQIVQAGITLITSLVQALPEIITAIVEAIPVIINSIISAILELLPLIIQAGIDLFVALIQALPEIITTIVQAIPQIIGGIIDALIGNIDKIILAGVQLFVALIENLPTIIIEIVKAIPQIITGIVDAIGSLTYKLVEAGGNLLKGIWEGISNAATWLWEKVKGWASGLVDGIKNFLGIHSPSTVFAEIGTNMGEGVGVGFSDSMGGVESDMTDAMGGAGKLTAAEAVRAVNDGIVANVDGLSGAVTAIVKRMITGLTEQAPQFNQAGQNFDNNIAQGMIVGIPQITSKITQIVQPIIAALRSYISEFSDIGAEMVRGIWQGFQNMRSWLVKKVRSMMKEIVAAVKDEMDIHSPSKVFAGIGKYMAQGLGKGFAREMHGVENTIRRETENIIPEYPFDIPGKPQRGGTPSVNVTQIINAENTSYAEQQRQAARQFRQIAREVMA